MPVTKVSKDSKEDRTSAASPTDQSLKAKAGSPASPTDAPLRLKEEAMSPASPASQIFDEDEDEDGWDCACGFNNDWNDRYLRALWSVQKLRPRCGLMLRRTRNLFGMIM